MGLRSAGAYSKKTARPYTRNSRKKSLAYIKSVPQNKIVKYQYGDYKSFLNGKHNYAVSLVSEQKVQMRDNAIESGRLLLSKMLDAVIVGQYYMMVKVHPHHLLRENKSAAAVAGADRISTGMTQSFGVIIGRAAMVRPGQTIFFVSCDNEKAARETKKVLGSIRSKMPCKTKIVFEKVK